MFKKIIVLSLMLGFSVIFLPAESKAAVVSEKTAINTATTETALVLPQNRRRRWRSRRWQNRRSRWERRDNRRDRRRDRREDRRDRREDRRDRRN